jgi:uncharacterized protein YPO0396
MATATSEPRTDHSDDQGSRKSAYAVEADAMPGVLEREGCGEIRHPALADRVPEVAQLRDALVDARDAFFPVALRAMEQHMRRLIDEISKAMERAKEEDREELASLRRDVQRHVEGSGGDQGGLVDSLETAEVRFEVDHPALAQSIRQVLDSLSSSGI